MAYSINPDKCTGCDACPTSCPVQAISGEHYRVHKIDPELCVSCGLCGNFCENFAIMNDEGRHASFADLSEWGIPDIDLDKCTGCTMCMELCPMFVLKLSEPEFRGDIHTHAYLSEPELCIGCGKCANGCGVGAIEMVKRGKSLED